VKLPYRLGESFALPLGDGTHVPAQILACGHHTVDIVAAGIALRVYDTALVEKRWRCHPQGRSPSTPLRYARDDTVGPAHAERIVATRLGLVDLAMPPLVVTTAAPYVPDIRPIRIAGELESVPPDVRVLHVTGRDALRDPRALLRFTKLEALRLVRVDASFDLGLLRALPLRWLSLEAMRDARNVVALRDCAALEQLELLGFWQCRLGEMLPLVEWPHLVRAEIDIGGRRKNAELYRSARWAYPWPFALFPRMNRSTSRVTSGSGSTQMRL
jgi:hypothetical protein